MPTALGQKRLLIAHLQNLAKGLSLIRRLFVVRLDDAISNPIPKVALFFQSAVVEPFRKINFVFVRDEGGLNLLFMPLRSLSQPRTGDSAGNQFGREFRRAFN